MRQLSTLRRHVALDRTDEYLSAWEVLRGAIEALQARAWVFRGVAHEDHFLEFIEWSGDVSPLDDAAVVEALERLDTFAPATAAEEWEQAQ